MSAEKSKRLSETDSYKGFQQSRTGNYVTRVSSDSHLFTTLHVVIGKRSQSIQKQPTHHRDVL